MSIENNLERIAAALEILAGSRPPGTSGGDVNESPTVDSPTDESPAPAKKASKAKPVAELKPVTIDTVDTVRAALRALQKATDAATAKGVLASFGVNTLSELDATQYGAVVAAATDAAAS